LPRKNWFAYSLVPLLAAVVFVESSARSQTGEVQGTIAKGQTIIIRERGKHHAYDFEDDLQLFGIEPAKLLFQNRWNGKLYRLMYVVGPSGGGADGQCGAGQEEDLIGQVLDSKWAQGDYNVELVASCAVKIEGVRSESYAVKQGKLTAEDRDDRDNVIRTRTYDSAKPEKAQDDPAEAVACDQAESVLVDAFAGGAGIGRPQLFPHLHNPSLQLRGQLFVRCFRCLIFRRRNNRVAKLHLQWGEALKRFIPRPSSIKSLDCDGNDRSLHVNG